MNCWLLILLLNMNEGTLPTQNWSSSTNLAKLVKIDVIDKNQLTSLIRNGIFIISDFDQTILAQCDQSGLEILKKLRINYTILDEILPNYDYYYVWALDEMASQNIPRFVTTIFVGDDYLICRIPQNIDIRLVQKYRIELKKINFVPIVSNFTIKEYPVVLYDSMVQTLVDRVSADSVLNFVQRLVNFQTRYSPTDSCRACANYIKEQFEAYGLDSVFVQEYNSIYAPNVIGIKRGISYPESIYLVLCGHFDCISGSPYTFAPGADDNGSGASGVLEAVRVMSGCDVDYTIRFIAFSGEEQGLLGSHYYASQARSHGDSIVGVINIDMVAYSLPGRDSASIIGKPENPNCAPLVDYFIACADTYTALKTQRQIIDRPRSDHASFNTFGYLAIHCRENLNVNNPYYHTIGDTIGGGFNNLEFCTEVIKASIATIASLAKPVLVGIEEKELPQPVFTVMPNPSQKLIKVKLMPGENKIKFYDITGKVIQLLSIHSNKTESVIDLTKMRPGIYFIEITNNKKQAKTKIVVN